MIRKLALFWMVSVAAQAAPIPVKTEAWVDAKFKMPEPVHLWVGVEGGSMVGRVYAQPKMGQVVGRGELAATCSVIQIHWRWNGSRMPKFAELDCKSVKLPSLRLPLHLEWVEKSGSLYEVRARKAELVKGLFASHG